MLKSLFVYVNYIRFFPHIITYKIWPEKHLMTEDLNRWGKILRPGKPIGIFMFVDILTFFPEFRNLFYARIRVKSKVF